jgi:type IV pilus assembly protein PilC
MAKLQLDKRIAAHPLTGAETVAEPHVSIWNRDIQIGPPVSPKDKRQFFQLLSILLESGLSITDSFSILIGQTKKKKFVAVLEQVQQLLNEGVTLSDALAKFPKHFTTFEVFSVKMGENSGNVVKILSDLGLYHEKRIRLQRKFTQALSYPIVVLIIAGVVLTFMIAFVVPMFEDSFKRFNTELPAMTRFVLGASTVLRDWGLLFLLVMSAGIFLLIRFKDTVAVRRVLTGIVMRTPLIGQVVFKIQLSRFCYSLALMLKSKVNLDQALMLLEQVTMFHPLQRVIGPIRKDVMEGETIYDAFRKHAIFPSVLLQMVKVGERTARLDQMMDNLGKTLEEEGETGVATLTSLLEPMLIVFLGVVVGVILLSMYLPMFEMTNTVK